MSKSFAGFRSESIGTSGAQIHCQVGGSGDPLLLLHGYPQTHFIWHKIASRLAEHYTVVATDLRGYGDSSKPSSTPDHAPYSKRAMALDQVEVMRKLGFSRFNVAGHDRGGRVAHRLALDHQQCVRRLAVLDIAPTRHMYQNTNALFARLYYHWFFLIQPFDLPERLIGADPSYYLLKKLGHGPAALSVFAPEALAEYQRCFLDLATVHASCEDYRAAASIDLEHDAESQGLCLECPLLVLWGEHGAVHRCFRPLEAWREVALDVRGGALPGGHYLAEELPDLTYERLHAFFSQP